MNDSTFMHRGDFLSYIIEENFNFSIFIWIESQINEIIFDFNPLYILHINSSISEICIHYVWSV